MTEDYHLQVQGERRGPYTLRQIDHMLNTGLIPPDSLFLREGMEDWHPVTNLVALRLPVSHLKRRLILAGVALVLALLARFFGPTVVEGWREKAQTDFTPRAAYWSARDAIRQTLPPGAPIKFHKFANTQVALQQEPPAATVEVGGEIIGSGQSATRVWKVELTHDDVQKLWTSTAVQEVGK